MNKLYLYNTLSREKEEFVPLQAGEARFYYCGPTVYWTQHIGNLRGAFCVDIVVRTLKYSGYAVNFVRNYTDVGHLTSDEDTGDDKMEKSAKREGLKPDEIAQKYIKGYEDDTRDLNYLEPDYKTRATKYIGEMIELVEILLKKGFAYPTDMAIYFDVSKAKDYTKLSGQKLEENICGAGSGEICDPGKRNNADFVLWFFRAGPHKNAIQYWPSPFSSPLVENGNGFPGWHLECTAMSSRYLGERFDIHGGGMDLTCPHHEAEMAQARAAFGHDSVRYWMHNNMITLNGQKMGKSLGNAISLDEFFSGDHPLLEKPYSPMTIRYFMLTAHYRSTLDFSNEALQAAEKGLMRLLKAVDVLDQISPSEKSTVKVQELKADCYAAMNDDLNTPVAIASLFEGVKMINSIADGKESISADDLTEL